MANARTVEGQSRAVSRSAASASVPASPSAWRTAFQRHGQLSEEIRRTGMALKRQAAENEKLRSVFVELERRIQASKDQSSSNGFPVLSFNGAEESLEEKAWIEERAVLLAEQQRLTTEIANARRRVQLQHARQKPVAQISTGTCLGCMALEADIDALSRELELRRQNQPVPVQSGYVQNSVSAVLGPTTGRSEEHPPSTAGISWGPMTGRSDGALPSAVGSQQDSSWQSSVVRRLSFGQVSCESEDKVVDPKAVDSSTPFLDSWLAEYKAWSHDAKIESHDAKTGSKTESKAECKAWSPNPEAGFEVHADASPQHPGRLRSEGKNSWSLKVINPEGEQVTSIETPEIPETRRSISGTDERGSISSPSLHGPEPVEVLAACGDALARGLAEMRAAVALLDSELGLQHSIEEMYIEKEQTANTS